MPLILVIEDDSSLRRTLVRMLLIAGHEVIEAANGRIALEKMAERPADLVLTDLIMPEMEGIETIRALLRDHPSLPIIAMSGGPRHSSESYLRMAEKLGARKTLAKPFEPRELLASIRDLCETKT
jgi:CheY-like chemotaxis protein